MTKWAWAAMDMAMGMATVTGMVMDMKKRGIQ
jgi:hypothetical protein